MRSSLTGVHLFAATITAVVLASCASTPPPDFEAGAAAVKVEQRETDRFNDLVSRDIVSVLVQIDDVSPNLTTLGTSTESWQPGEFASELRRKLEIAGYAIRSVGAGPRTLQMGYTIAENGVSLPDELHGESQTVTVMLGNIAVRRSYLINSDGVISPLGQMQVKGIDASQLVLNSDIFASPDEGEPGQGPTEDTLARVPETAGQVVEIASPVTAAPPATENVSGAALVNPAPLPGLTVDNPEATTTVRSELPEKPTFLDLVAPTVPVTEPAPLPALSSRQARQTQNVMELRQSNFEDLFTEMGIVQEKVLTFGNDSTRMGDVNKARLRDVVDKFNPISDMISVVGCSLGNTDYEGGQEGLALGRAMRVREELLYAGIPGDRILEEGCWAEEAFDLRMPRRGVVVTLKRRVG